VIAVDRVLHIDGIGVARERYVPAGLGRAPLASLAVKWARIMAGTEREYDAMHGAVPRSRPGGS
jgi:hypothetical protein